MCISHLTQIQRMFACFHHSPTAAFAPELQFLAVDESKVYSPPDKLLLPETQSTNSDSALSLQEDSDMSSSASSSPTYSPAVDRPEVG